MINAVLKIGGSILQNARSKDLFTALSDLVKQYSFVILPGGGDFANLVRKYYRTDNISEDKSHWMAILCENILGFLILEKLPLGIPVFRLSEVPKVIKKSKIPVFLPFEYLFEQDPLPHSWEVTSDSIAAYLAEALQVQKLILIKDVDGIYSQDPKTDPKNGMTFLDNINLNSNVLSNLPSCCIDSYLPVLLKKYGRSCYIVNGLHPERVEKILRGEKAIYTLLEI